MLKLTIHEVAELVSLVTTIPTIVMSLMVVGLYGRAAVDGMQHKPRSQEDWLILGICLGFIGAVLDNGYWFIPWFFEFIDHPWSNAFIMNGVYFNIFSRQACGVAASYCHIKGAILADKNGARKLAYFNIMLVTITITSMVSGLFLVLVKALP